ncbi:WcaI family glycosyltransferase [Salmonirosea aquatica]|uniref:WcaI family glycosyltransferase n=1 Tax=Salmonirosea aquatica TaxID=2654236 RepID=A0A7C9BF28_9BACT|nr:WcaI family glycosyltransferase [Cytophagaceae bacterium SJW1-29]
MRILLYGINYAPELTGIGKYSGQMGAWLAGRGHEVSVITAKPYYPQWRIHKNYRAWGWRREEREGVKVYRCPLYVPAQASSFKRILHEFSFLASSLPIWLGMLFQKKYDVIVCISPPFHLGVLPWLYGKLRGVPFVIHVQDLQVDAAKKLGMIRNAGFLRLMFGLERGLLQGSAAVTTISEGMRRRIAAKGIPREKLILFLNWVNSHLIYPLPREKSLREGFGLKPQDQVLLYAGNLGEKQGLELIIEVAKQFATQRVAEKVLAEESFSIQGEIVFVIVGTGGERKRLEALAREAQLTNVRFFPLQPYEKMSALLAVADVHLIIQKQSASDLVMPSKLTGILAAGGCALVTAQPGTSLYEVVARHRLGLLVEPESVEALVAGIGEALTTDLTPYRQNARAFAERHLNKESVLAGFEEVLKLLVRGKQSLSKEHNLTIRE